MRRWSSGRRWRRALVVAGCLLPMVSATPAVPASAAEISAFDAVNQFIGTELDQTQNKSNDAYGNTFPGATVPFGMVQPSPTTWAEGNANVGQKGGYEYTASLIRGFGMTRYDGTGCTGRFGGYEFPTVPYAGELTNGTLPASPASDIKRYYLPFSHANEEAQPGYYSVKTDNGVSTQLTASARTAVSRFDFPRSGSSTLILDVSGPNNRTFGSEVTIDPRTRTVSGWMYGVDVCDNGNYYKAYFSTTYDQDFASYGTWTDDAMTAGSTHAVKSTTDVGVDYRHDTGAWLTFKQGAKVVAKTGFSYTSVANAALNRDTEVGDAGFNNVKSDAKKLWKDALGTIDAAGGSTEQRTKFYTALYHTFLNPTVRDDVNGQYLGFDDKVHAVEQGHHFYKNINYPGSGWDAYRSQVQLVALTFPHVANDINRSIVALTEQRGSWAPGAARMQGDNYQVILATLDDMGATGYDRAAALASMKKTQVLPATTTSRTDGYQYFATGMIENAKGDFATSRVLEYSIDDFAVAQLAARLGDKAAYDFFAARSQNWMNVFDPVTQHIRPRSRSGFDRSFDLRVRDDSAGRGQFNQSTGYQYGWLVPQNMSTLIAKRGGIAQATSQLDVLMQQLDAGAYTQTGNYLSNQPAFGTPWVYNWLQAPAKATDVLYRAVSEMYDTTPSGLPGNDDTGSLSAWYVFANLGLYPAVYGTGDLVVSAPMFDRIVIDPIGGTHKIKMTATGVAAGSRYVNGLEVNGKAQTKSWLDSSFVRTGGTLDFTMGTAPGTWGTATADVPPSWTDGADARNSVGTTPDGQGNLGSLDLSDWSLSRQSLAAAGVTPGATVPGTAFTWPTAEPGRPDNWIPHGQRVTVTDATPGGTVSFLGLSTNGPAAGTAVVTYTDGTNQDVPLTLSDWAAGPAPGETAAVTLTGRNNANGTAGGGTFRIFASAPAALDPAKKVASVTLPQTTDKGIMHIFDVAVS
ncbi:GH92 family glycosyl hydrolase [Actinoplanes sp. N902-109]|uniref:GH92 family glycosyl hydrolase n=1 Tax=Actinoplanes sp. (strain N902-109) TaxID=649831 RepID=UPI0003294439|nr:GH92 family glycosyl hydrolase [Actinoplanes sp. N902-109]AGL16985.1 alpha-1,2-mannosidase [Actinoplanes sp. N902-109]